MSIHQEIADAFDTYVAESENLKQKELRHQQHEHVRHLLS